jgi:plasmid stabilization system protein ParE
MFRVVWLQAALDELTTIWLQADSAARQAITAAAHTIDQELAANPHEQGESRGDDERIFFALPLGVLFEIEDQFALVRILHVWDIRRRQ